MNDTHKLVLLPDWLPPEKNKTFLLERERNKSFLLPFGFVPFRPRSYEHRVIFRVFEIDFWAFRMSVTKAVEMFGTKNTGCSERKVSNVRNVKYKMFGTKNTGCSERKVPVQRFFSRTTGIFRSEHPVFFHSEHLALFFPNNRHFLFRTSGIFNSVLPVF